MSAPIPTAPFSAAEPLDDRIPYDGSLNGDLDFDALDTDDQARARRFLAESPDPKTSVEPSD
jgi:hypothetical protein